MNHQQFKDKYLGKNINIDVYQGIAQCTSVPKAYIAEVHGKRWRALGGFPTPEGGAINAFLNYPNSLIYPEDYDLIENIVNDPNCQPIQGDIVIWGQASGLTTRLGHIAVCDSANSQNFNSIDQNWNDGRGLHTKIVNHTYRGVLGWLRLKQTTPKPPTNNRFYTVKYGGWRSQVIQEIINAGIWGGTWEQNEPKFLELNGLPPEGGYRAGMQVRIAPDPQVDSIKAPEPVVLPTPTPVQLQPEPIPKPVVMPKPEVVTEVEKPNPEKFDLNKLIVGIVSGKNPLTNSAFLVGLVGIYAFYNENQQEINAALVAISQGVAVLYTMWRKYEDNKKAEKK